VLGAESRPIAVIPVGQGAHVEAAGRRIGPGEPTFIVAEMSANHNRDFDRAVALVGAAAEAGADAIKLQTYAPDTLTLDCDNDWFRIKGEGPWAGRRLYDLYAEAAMPWDWQPRLLEEARRLGLILYSTPFDETAVDFLESLDVPAYKIASFEVTHVPLLRKVGATGKPVFVSTGMATEEGIDQALDALRAAGGGPVVLLKCTSAYPAPPEEANLRAMRYLAHRFERPVGLSDHTLGGAVAVAAVALGACVVEKHITLNREDGGPDAAFSMEPDEFADMVRSVRTVERALGEPRLECGSVEGQNRMFRQSLFVVADMKAGEEFTRQNMRVIRPGHGLTPASFDRVLGKRAAKAVSRGTPLTEDLIQP